MTDIKFCGKDHFRILKAIAILSVMVAHAGNNSGVTWFTPLGGIGVAIFLFCSGYGITFSVKNSTPAKFWLKRLLAIYLEFFAFEIVNALIFRRDIVSFFSGVVFYRLSNVYFWYLRYLIFCYLIAWLVIYFVKSEKVQIAIFLSVVVVSFSAFYVLDESLYAEQSLSFVSGILAAMYLSKKIGGGYTLKASGLYGVLLLVVGCTALALKQLSFFRIEHTAFMIPLNLILKFSAALGMVFISYLLGKWLKFLCVFGDMSYSMYLIHSITINIVAHVMIGNWYISAAVFFVVTVLLTLIWYYPFNYIKAYLAKKIT